MKKRIYVLIAILSMFILVSAATAQLKPNDYYRVYTIRGDWFWSWQIDYKTNEMINNSKFWYVKDRIIAKIGFDSFYNITFSTIVDIFQRTGIMWNSDFIFGFRWIPRSIHNWIEIKILITALLMR